MDVLRLTPHEATDEWNKIFYAKHCNYSYPKWPGLPA